LHGYHRMIFRKLKENDRTIWARIIAASCNEKEAPMQTRDQRQRADRRIDRFFRANQEETGADRNNPVCPKASDAGCKTHCDTMTKLFFGCVCRRDHRGRSPAGSCWQPRIETHRFPRSQPSSRQAVRPWSSTGPSRTALASARASLAIPRIAIEETRTRSTYLAVVSCPAKIKVRILALTSAPLNRHRFADPGLRGGV